MSEKRPLFTRPWESKYSKAKKWMRIVAYAIVFVLLFCLIYFRVFIFGNLQEKADWTILNLYFTFLNPESSFIYSLLNGLLMGAYLAILVNVGQMNKYIRLFLVVFTLVFAILGVAIGICLGIYLPLFSPQNFESNTVDGINFLVGNIGVLMIIFFASLVAESEVAK